jgi:hypothetical protein
MKALLTLDEANSFLAHYLKRKVVIGTKLMMKKDVGNFAIRVKGNGQDN